VNRFVYFKVSARITNSKSFRAWRAKAFVLADDCNEFYFGDEKTTIYYENDDILLSILFERQVEARKFRSTWSTIGLYIGFLINVKATKRCIYSVCFLLLSST
jgi:hypothetical protein